MLDQRYLPNPPEAVRLYEQETGGRISEESGFGLDPIGTDANKCSIKKQAFFDRYPSFEDIFNNLINSNSVVFRSALLYYIDITYRLFRSSTIEKVNYDTIVIKSWHHSIYSYVIEKIINLLIKGQSNAHL